MAEAFRKSLVYYFHRYFELAIWIVGLFLLATMSPENDHASLCPFNAMGLSFCPGCGLGHSISWLFRGEFNLSFQTHPLGWFAVIMLLFRIITLLRNLIKKPSAGKGFNEGIYPEVNSIVSGTDKANT